MNSVLEVKNIVKDFGKVRAVDGVSLAVLFLLTGSLRQNKIILI